MFVINVIKALLISADRFQSLMWQLVRLALVCFSIGALSSSSWPKKPVESLPIRCAGSLLLLVSALFLANLYEEYFWSQSGTASWYGPGFYGRKTASGKLFEPGPFLTAAHKTLPLGTIVKVHNRNNNLNIQVKINDRGPYIRGRIIDLSKYAAEKIDMLNKGTAPVTLTIVKRVSDKE